MALRALWVFIGLLASQVAYGQTAVSANSVAAFTQQMQHAEGYFDFYYDQQQDKIYLKIEQFDQPFLFQSSLPQGIGSNDIGLDRGQLGDTRLVKFERYGNKVMLKQLNTAYRASSSNPAEQASIDEAFADSVIAGLAVVASDDKAVVVDYTPFLLSDIHNIAAQLESSKQGSYKPDPLRSGVFLARSKAFVDNTELEALVTFAGSKAGEFVKQVTPDANSISVHLHHSLIRLPDNHYQTRQFTPFSGYWSVAYQDYSAALEQDMTVKVIPRHRLQKRDATLAVSEAVEPIVYYLDPGIPEPVMSALRDGAQWWDQAFQKIGYKNAFQVKVLPADADPMDVRYNVIQWVHRATRGWSYGSSVIDPRTGEIIKGHVTLGSLRVRQDYLIALGLTSPFSQDNTDTSAQRDMALARIRQLAAHEVGHTLGIAHNFAASEYGRESVMDYPHPVISINKGEISLDGAYATGMGKWDDYVIAYGYQDFADSSNEQSQLAVLVQNARQQGLRYQSDPDARPAHASNPQGNLWDNGKDALAELQHLTQVRAIALQNFGIHSLPKGANLSSLEETLVPIYLLHRYQLEAVAKLVGGVNYEYELKGDYPQAKGNQAVNADKQREAVIAVVASIQPDFLKVPAHISALITPKAYGSERNRESFQGRSGVNFDPLSAAESVANYSVSLLLQAERLNRLAQQAEQQKNALNVSSLLQQILAGSIMHDSSNNWSELQSRINYVVLHAMVQAKQQPMLAPEVAAKIDIELHALHAWLKNKQRNPQHAVIARWLDQYFTTGTWSSPFKPMPMPPGSPI
jgi:hypothetical protein